MDERTRRSLVTVARGLIAYGVIGIVLAVVLLGAVVAISNRLDEVAGRLTGRLDTISQTFDRTAAVLDDAASTSTRFSTTVAQAVPTLQQVDTSLGEVVTTLHELQATTATLTILGQTPLASLSDRFGRIADQLAVLQGQVSTLGANLGTNTTNLAALGTSLSALASQLRAVNDVLGSGEIESSLGDLIGIVRLALGLLAVWFAVPAIGALAFGLWLRREIAGRTEPGAGGAPSAA